MKFTTTAVVLAIVTGALAAPAPAPKPWCLRPSEPCFKAKRSPEPKPWCLRPSEPCYKAKRAPEPMPWCLRPSEPCFKAKRAADALIDSAVDSADAEPEGVSLYAVAAYDQLAHLAARAAGDELPVAKRDTETLWCTGSSLQDISECWKQAAAAVHQAEKRWCLRPSQPCWKVKRAAEAVLAARGEDDVKRSDDDSAEAAECHAEGGQCSETKRDLEDLHHVARAIVETF